MKGGGAAKLRKVLEILPLIRGERGIRVAELSRLTGIPEREIVEDLPALVNFCGVPPYSPMDLVDLEVEGDLVTLRFAEAFRRPVRLTPREALALDMALSGWEGEEEGLFGRAVESIRAKVRAALSPEVAEEIEQVGGRIGAPETVGLASRMLRDLKQALALQVEVRMEYFSHRTGRLSERVVEPYGIYEKQGRWYLVARCRDRGAVLTFRADRIRDAELLDDEYEIPDDFDVGAYRGEGPPDTGAEGIEAEIRFDAGIARFAREDFPGEEAEEAPDGSLTVRLRYSGSFWLVGRILKWGAGARVIRPEELRIEVRERAREALELYGG